MLINLNIDKAAEIFANFAYKGVILEMVENGITGNIFKLSNGAIIASEKYANPLVIIAGELNNAAVQEVIALINDKENSMIYCAQQYNHLFLPYGWNFHLRISFVLDTYRFFPLENGLRVKTIEEYQDFSNCRWYKDTINVYGSHENFIKYGRGYLLCREDEVLNEIYLYVGGKHAEFNIITNPNYRKKGYGVMLASYVIKQLLAEGLSPCWSCRADNTASINTALKLGFKISNYHIWMVKKYGNVLCKNFEISPDPDYAI